MNMAKDMVLGFNPLFDSMQQVHTSTSIATISFVTKPQRRTMGHQNICVWGDVVPFVQTFLASLRGWWLVGWPINLQSLYLHARILQVDTTCQFTFKISSLRIPTQLMVTSNNYLIFVRKLKISFLKSEKKQFQTLLLQAKNWRPSFGLSFLFQWSLLHVWTHHHQVL